MQNNVAAVIKVYAIINGSVGIILAIIALSSDFVSNYGKSVVFIIVGITLVCSFGIFAVGEIIQLLQDIKANTKNYIQQSAKNELPPL